MPAAVSVWVTRVRAAGMEKVPFERVLGLAVGEALQVLHESKGVVFEMQRTVQSIEDDGNGGVAGKRAPQKRRPN